MATVLKDNIEGLTFLIGQDFSQRKDDRDRNIWMTKLIWMEVWGRDKVGWLKLRGPPWMRSKERQAAGKGPKEESWQTDQGEIRGKGKQ